MSPPWLAPGLRKSAQTRARNKDHLMRILLVAAALEGAFSARLEDRPSWVEEHFPGLLAKAYMPPLHMATIAALIPDEHTVVLHDENVQGYIGPHSYPDTHFDIVGVGGYSNHLPRALKV